MTKIPHDVLKKISETLSKSSFGTSIAEILADPDFQMPCKNGIWDIEKNGRKFSINIEDYAIEFTIRCGIHFVSYLFDVNGVLLLTVTPRES